MIRPALTAFYLCTLMGASGCAAPVALSTVGLTAAQVGTEAWVAGELRTAVYADLEEVLDAVHGATDDLEVSIITERRGEKSAYIMAKEPGGPEIKVTMIRRTPRLTRIGIRVGLIGDMATSRVVLHRIGEHLPPEAAPPGN